MKGVNYGRPRWVQVPGATGKARRILARIGVLERRIEMCGALFYWPAYIQTWQRDLRVLRQQLKALGYVEPKPVRAIDRPGRRAALDVTISKSA